MEKIIEVYAIDNGDGTSTYEFNRTSNTKQASMILGMLAAFFKERPEVEDLGINYISKGE